MNVVSLANVEKLIVIFACSIIKMPGSDFEHVDKTRTQLQLYTGH